MPGQQMSEIIPVVIEQHAEEAAFLWILRDGAVRAPHYSLKDLAKLDLRVEAQLDGLRIAAPQSWDILRESLKREEAGEIFAAAVIAFENGDPLRIETVLEAGTATPELSRGLVSAVGWLAPEKADRLIPRLLASPSKSRRRVGVAGAAIRRLDLEKSYLEAVGDSDPLLCARGLRALAQLGMKKHAALFSRYLSAEDSPTGYAAAWSAALVAGDPDAVSALQRYALNPGWKAREALILATRRMSPKSATGWREKLAGKPETLRQAAISAGAAGNPEAVPWLLEQMNIPPVARAAGEALSMITGVDLAYLDLDTKRPEELETGPNDDPDDENVQPDPDEDLPWPQPSLLRSWWETVKGKYAPGKRYLMSMEISVASCLEALRTGRQRQRAAAALELAFLRPGQPLVEVRSPGFR
jgi:uncharacterized protein (TIGR02270 family)